MNAPLAGEEVIWLRTPRGGYTMRVSATVLKRTEKRVRIAAQLVVGSVKAVWVKPESLVRA